MLLAQGFKIQEMRDSFLKKGYCLVDYCLTLEQCQELLMLIEHYSISHEVPKVYRQTGERSLCYFVIDGRQIERHLPTIDLLYQDFNTLVNQVSDRKLAPLENKRVGVNINLLQKGGEYRWHYDRNEVTVVLYLNQVQGGNIEFYPNYRFDLIKNRFNRIQQYLDSFIQLKFMRQIFGKKLSVAPAPGKLLIMQANRCLHSVSPVEDDQTRISIIMAYNSPGTEFPVDQALNSYLYSQKKLDLSDPNYL